MTCTRARSRGERTFFSWMSLARAVVAVAALGCAAQEAPPVDLAQRAYVVSKDHDALTVIEINGLDRPGLLYDVTREISDLNLDIASAHIATFGEKAVDVFYVTDLTGKKITSKSREASIRARLLKALAARHEAQLVPA